MNFTNGLLLTLAPTTVVMAPGQAQHTENLGSFDGSGFVDSILDWAFSNPIVSAVLVAIVALLGMALLALIVLDFK